jgi:hypothetical protein
MLALWGCAVPTTLPRTPLSATTDGILKRLQEDDEGVRTMQAFGSLRWSRGGEKGSVDHAIIIRRPDALRLEALTPMGPALFSLVLRMGKVELFAPSESKVYQGDASVELMERFFALPLKPQEAMAVLCGRVPICAVQRATSRAEGDLLLLDITCQSEGWTQRIRVEPTTQDVVGFNILDPSGDVVFSVNWGDFLEVDGVRLPGEVRAEMPSKGNSLIVRYKDVEVNAPISEERFQLRIPPGTDIRPLS